MHNYDDVAHDDDDGDHNDQDNNYGQDDQAVLINMKLGLQMHSLVQPRACN